MSEFRWRYIDELTRPYFIDDEDKCVYAREHHPGGYEVSESNRLIFNYKKPVSRRGLYEYQYKIASIKQFAREISLLKFPPHTCLIPVPPSKVKDNPEHDDRLIKTLQEYKRLNPEIAILDIININHDIPSSHAEGGHRNPNEILPFLQLTATPEINSKFAFIVDDVVTTGGHFKACQMLLKENYPEVSFYGLFWALHVFSDDE